MMANYRQGEGGKYSRRREEKSCRSQRQHCLVEILVFDGRKRRRKGKEGGGEKTV